MSISSLTMHIAELHSLTHAPFVSSYLCHSLDVGHKKVKFLVTYLRISLQEGLVWYKQILTQTPQNSSPLLWKLTFFNQRNLALPFFVNLVFTYLYFQLCHKLDFFKTKIIFILHLDFHHACLLLADKDFGYTPEL